jgi:glycine/D-amino acid oxidase-like deaminating enzyme
MIDTLPDIVPVVDHVDALPGLVVCTGMCGHGFGIGPAFGRITARLALGQGAGFDLTRFRMSRFFDGSKLLAGPNL